MKNGRHISQLLHQNGTHQGQRQLSALDPASVRLDERNLEELWNFAHQLAGAVRYFDENNLEMGNWQEFFPSWEERDPQKPHQALFHTFLQLFAYAQDQLNDLSRRHLEFYYYQVLGIEEKAPVPDKVQVIIELARHVQSHLLKEGTTFSAGKDASGKDLFYRLERETALNRAKVGSLKTVFRDVAHESRIYAAPVANSADGQGKAFAGRDGTWYAFGAPQAGRDPKKRNMVAGEIGFAIASPQLFLREGKRTITLGLFFFRKKLANEALKKIPLPNKDLILDNFHFYFSGEKEWIGPFTPTNEVYNEKGLLRLTLVVNSEHPAIVSFRKDQLSGGFDTQWPVMKMILNPAANTGIYEQLIDLQILLATLMVDVKELSDLVLQNDQAFLNPAHPFQPFGAIPAAGSSFYIGSTEVFQKKLSDLYLHLEWHQVPVELWRDYYQDYIPEVMAYREAEEAVKRTREAWVKAQDEAALAEKRYHNANHIKPLYDELIIDRTKVENEIAAVNKAEEKREDAQQAKTKAENEFKLAESDEKDKNEKFNQANEEWTRQLGPYREKRSAFYMALAIERSARKQKEILDNGWLKAGSWLIPFAGLAEEIEDQNATKAYYDSVKKRVTAQKEFDQAVENLKPFAKAKNDARLDLQESKATLVKAEKKMISTSQILKNAVNAVKSKKLTLESGETKEISVLADLKKLSQAFEQKEIITAIEDYRGIRQKEISQPEDVSLQLAATQAFGKLSGTVINEYYESKANNESAQASLILAEKGYDLANKQLKETKGRAEKVLERFTNDHFKIKITLLNNGTWSDPLKSGVPIVVEADGLNSGLRSSQPTLFETTSAQSPHTLFLSDISKQLDSRTPTYSRLAPHQIPDRYSAKANNGFLKLELDVPDTPFPAFGHSVYPQLYTQTTIKKSKDPDSLAVLPKLPYTPTLKSVKLSYHSRQNLVFNTFKVAGMGTIGEEDQFFHIHPFGHSEIQANHWEQQHPYLLPQYPAEGYLYIGVEELLPPQSISLLFHFQEGSENPDKRLKSGDVRWSYLTTDGWKSFGLHQIPYDTTSGMLYSGIMTFSIPAEAASDNPEMPPGMHWLRASVPNNSAGICQLISVQAQAVTAVFTDQDNDPTHLLHPLSAGSIAQLEFPQTAIRQVSQPFASQGGQARESAPHLNQRVSERLRHKQRALSAWDYERLVLEQFPEIFKVKCLPHQNEKGEHRPGHVSLILIPNTKNKNLFDPLEPKLSPVKMEQVKAYLAPYLSPFIQVHLRHAHYERILLDFKAGFRVGFDHSIYAQQLQQDLRKFLAPWAFEAGLDIPFDNVISKAKVIQFVEEQLYIDFVLDFRMYQLLDSLGLGAMRIGMEFSVGPYYRYSDAVREAVGKESSFGINHSDPDDTIGEDYEFIEGTTPASILTSAALHKIQVISQGQYLPKQVKK